MFMTEWTVGAGAGFAHARALREAVRVYEQGISSEQEFDAMDAVAAHLFVCTDAGEPIAAGRMYPSLEHDAVRIDRHVVAPAFRGKQYDDLLLRVMLYKAQQMPFSAIEASVGEAERELLTGFGFRPAGLPQTGQDIVFFVPCSGVIWDSACKHVGHSGQKPE